jgi:hypothetical protein
MSPKIYLAEEERWLAKEIDSRRKRKSEPLRRRFGFSMVGAARRVTQRGSVLTAAPTTGAQVNRISWAQPQHERVLRVPLG